MKETLCSEEFLPVDREFGAFLARLAGNPGDGRIALAGKLLSRAVREGDTHIRIGELSGEGWEEFLCSRACSAAVGVPGPRGRMTPLVLDGGRLYLRRFYNYERETAERLMEMARAPVFPPRLDPERMKHLFGGLSETLAADGINDQKLAVYNALSRKLAVISGGPGTGKTTVAAALLALELERNPALKIIVAAPTGKAKARLGESLCSDGRRLNMASEIRTKMENIPAFTLHSLMEADPRTGTFRKNSENPVECDLLLIDECSMIPLTLMAHLLRALRRDTRLVMLGDRFQLASVEAGALFGELCDAAGINCFAPEIVSGFVGAVPGPAPRTASEGRPLGGVVAELSVNRRFASAPAIGRVAEMIRNPDGESAAFIARCDAPDFHTLPRLEPAGLKKHLEPWMEMIRLAESDSATVSERMFECMDDVKILTVLRQGPFGSIAVNREISRMLGLRGDHAPGTPVMVTVNHARTGLNNGDIGVVRRERGVFKVFFPRMERGIPLGAMPPHETVFAMTVHKSQGSGFGKAIVILPDKPVPVLSRELLYTGVTRARREVELFSSEEMIRYALEHPTRRDSGLGARWTPPDGN